MSSLHLTLFGPPRAGRNGVPVSFHCGQTLALLAYLAAADLPHSRDALAALSEAANPYGDDFLAGTLAARRCHDQALPYASAGCRWTRCTSPATAC